MKHIFILVLVCLSHDAIAISFPTYSDIVALEAECSPRDTCQGSGSRGRRLLSPRERNCGCDQVCVDFDDCCIDSPFWRRDDGDSPESRSVTCRDTVLGSFHMRSKCPADWADDALRDLCEKEAPVSDPLRQLPVTDPSSGITYKNSFCAQCDNVSNDPNRVSDLMLWNTRVECPNAAAYNFSGNLTDEYVLQNLIFIESERRWGLIFDHPEYCEVQSYPTEFVSQFLRQCSEVIVDKCPLDYKNKTIAAACQSYQAILYSDDGFRRVFRNPHCALCHNFNTSSLMCLPKASRKSPLSTTIMGRNPSAGGSFSILFDVTNNAQLGAGAVGQSCDRHEVYDPFRKVCRTLICGLEGYAIREGKCLPLAQLNVTIMNSNETVNGSLNSTESSFEVMTGNSSSGNNASLSSDLKHRFKTCLKVSLEPDMFLLLTNNSIFLLDQQQLLNETDYTMNGSRALVCSKYEAISAKFSSIEAHLTITGITISIVCLALHLIAFLMLPEMKNMSGKNLASLSFCLLLGYVCFIVRSFSWIISSPLACSIIGVVMYHSFLSSFLWTNILSFDVCRTLRLASTRLKVASGKQMSRYIVYASYALLISSISSALVLCLDLDPPRYFTESDFDLRPHFQQGSCWFQNRLSLLIFFVAPVAIILLINFVLFILTSVIIVKTSASTASAFKSQSSSQARRDFPLYVRLSVLMGLTWITGLIASLIDHQIFWLFFIFLNTLQGLFIFINFTCAAKTRKAIGERLTTNSFAVTDLWSQSNNRSSSAYNVSS